MNISTSHSQNDTSPRIRRSAHTPSGRSTDRLQILREDRHVFVSPPNTAARRGTKSLMSRDPVSAQLPSDTLQAAIEGLIALHEMELKEIHRLIFGANNHLPMLLAKLRFARNSGDRIVGRNCRSNHSVRSGTKALEVLSLDGVCKSCMEPLESRHGEVRKKVWAALPDVFGLKTRVGQC